MDAGRQVGFRQEEGQQAGRQPGGLVGRGVRRAGTAEGHHALVSHWCHWLGQRRSVLLVRVGAAWA